jgi:hypothetical protein
MYPADQIPCRIPALQEFLYLALRLCQFDAECGIQFFPESAKDLHAQIFRTGHGRRGLNQPIQLSRGRSRNMDFLPGDIGIRVRAKSGHIPCAEFSPVGEDRRKRSSGFRRSQLQKTVACTSRKGVSQTLSKLGIEVRRVGRFD